MKREEIVAAGGAHCDGAFVLWLLGIVFIVLGIVSDAMNVNLVLQPISWFLLAIFFWAISHSELDYLDVSCAFGRHRSEKQKRRVKSSRLYIH